MNCSIVDQDIIDRALRIASDAGQYDQVAVVVRNYEASIAMAGDPVSGNIIQWHLDEFAKWGEGYRRILDAYSLSRDLTAAAAKVAASPDRSSFNLEETICQIDVTTIKGIVKASFIGTRTGNGCTISEIYHCKARKGFPAPRGSAGLPMTATKNDFRLKALKIARMFAKVEGFPRLATVKV
jgi:hypothetical protein